MKATCWMGARNVEVQEVPDPQIMNGRDAIVRITSTAICGSDLHLYDGYIPGMRKGDILGHEFMGEVIEVGPAVRNLKAGDRVVVPFTISCGNCLNCERGLFSVCENSNPNASLAERAYGSSPAGAFGYSHMLGGFAGGQAEYARVPFAGVGPIRIASDLPDEKVLFLSDIFTTGYWEPSSTTSDRATWWRSGAPGPSASLQRSWASTGYLHNHSLAVRRPEGWPRWYRQWARTWVCAWPFPARRPGPLRDVSIYVSDFEQRRLVPIPGSVATASLDIEASLGGESFSSVRQVEEPVDGGVRLWSVVVDGAARLGVISVTTSALDDEGRALADSLAGVAAALLVTRGQCTDAYTAVRRSRKFSLAAEMQWDLLPPLSLDSGRVSVAGLIQPAYEVGGDAFDYAVNGDTLGFAVFDAMGHGLLSSQLAHLAVTSYRHSRRSGLDLEATYQAMDAAVAARGRGEEFVTCVIGQLDLDDGTLSWINVGHPLPLLVRGGECIGRLACAATLPAGLGHGLAGDRPVGDGVAEIAYEVLRPGDRVFCITDGLVDSHRRGGEDFGERRLVELLDDRSRGGVDAAETVRQLSHTVVDHHGVLSDDTTAFLVDYHGPRPRGGPGA